MLNLNIHLILQVIRILDTLQPPTVCVCVYVVFSLPGCMCIYVCPCLSMHTSTQRSTLSIVLQGVVSVFLRVNVCY